MTVISIWWLCVCVILINIKCSEGCEISNPKDTPETFEIYLKYRVPVPQILALDPGCFNRGKLLPNEKLKSAESTLFILEEKLIGEFAFQNSRNAKSLSLLGDSLVYIQSRAFNNLEQLTILHVTRTSLEGIPMNIFNNHVNLTRLRLNNNKIFWIQSEAFSNLPKLTDFSLSGNQLTQWNPEWFKNVPSLITLLLDNNSIRYLPNNSFLQFTNLRKLELSKNKICNVSPFAFKGISLLSFMFLNNNNIRNLDENIFLDLGKNENCQIELAWNQLTYLPKGLLKTIEDIDTLTIDNNPWLCPCLNQIKTWGSENDVFLGFTSSKNWKDPICVASKKTSTCLEEDDLEARDYIMNMTGRQYESCL